MRRNEILATLKVFPRETNEPVASRREFNWALREEPIDVRRHGCKDLPRIVARTTDLER